MSQDVIEKAFSVSGRAKLVISNVRGSVVVRSGAPDTVNIQAVKHTGSGSHIEVRMSQDEDGTVHVEARNSNGMLGFMSFSKPMKVDITATVPTDSDLTASVVSSGLVVSDLRGNIDLNGVSGNVELADLSGPLKVKTVSGDISAARLEGTLIVEAVSGDVRMQESQLGSAEVRTVSGDVQLETPLGEGPYQFNTVSGDVRLLTKPETQCTAELNTISGRIVTPMPQSANRARGTSQTLQIQGGGVRVFLKSVSGNLIISNEEELAAEPVSEALEAPIPPAAPQESAPPEPPLPPEPPVPNLTTAEILEKIERGEMSVDEGLKLIQGG